MTDSSPSLHVYWKISAALTVGLPIVLFLFVELFTMSSQQNNGGGQNRYNNYNNNGWNWYNNGREGGGDQNNNRRGWWYDNNDRPPEEGGHGFGQAFVYFWSLAVFGVLIWRGNHVLRADKDIRALFVALVVFANLAFMCWILVATGQPARGGEPENARIMPLSAVETLTFFLMMVFCVSFSTILYKKAQRKEQLPPAAEGSWFAWLDPEPEKPKTSDVEGIM
jgi:hypothetical protein